MLLFTPLKITQISPLRVPSLRNVFLFSLLSYPGWLERVGCRVSAPPVADQAVEPSLEAAEVVHVVHVGLGQGDVADKVLEAGLLLVHRLHLAAIVIHITVIGGHSATF